MLTILISTCGLSCLSVFDFSMACTTSEPLVTLPNDTVCLPSSHGVAAVVMKNCDPLVLGPRVGHGHRIRAIVPQIPRDLVLKLPAPYRDPPRAVPERVPGLQHEPLDDAVEDDVVIVPVSAVRCEVLASLRARFREQLDVDVPDGGVNDRGAG